MTKAQAAKLICLAIMSRNEGSLGVGIKDSDENENIILLFHGYGNGLIRKTIPSKSLNLSISEFVSNVIDKLDLPKEKPSIKHDPSNIMFHPDYGIHWAFHVREKRD